MNGYEVLAEPAGLEAEGTQWNVTFTRLLRNTERYAWGNWTLDPSVKVGVLGWFNPGDTTLQFARSELSGLPILDLPTSQDFHLEAGQVRQTTVGVKFDVPYKDPTTGLEVNVGLKSTWDFGSAGSLSAQGSACGIAQVDKVGKVLTERYQEILAVAKVNGKAHGEEIDQGFGMITKVWLTDGCVNVGSLTETSSFEIVGSVDGVAAMTGSDQSAKFEGSYKDTSKSTNVEKRLFPAADNMVAPKPVAYAYEFSTFAGHAVIARYVEPISTLTLRLNESGSYIANVSAKFDTPDGKQERTMSVSGGMSGVITGIPLAATNMDIRIDFVAGSTQFLSVSNPLNTWFGGVGTIDAGGWWPGSTHAKWV